MKRPLSNLRPIGPLVSQNGGVVQRKPEGQNLEDAVIGHMHINLTRGTDLNALDNLNTFGRDNKPELFDRTKTELLEAMNDYLGIFAPHGGYTESNVGLVLKDMWINDEPVNHIADVYFWIWDAVNVKNSPREGTEIDTSWEYLQRQGIQVRRKVKSEFTGKDPDVSRYGEHIDVEADTSVVKIVSSGMVPKDVNI